MSPDTLNTAVSKLFSEEKLLITHFTIHDLRRSTRTLLASLKVPPHVSELCLNHKLKGVEGVYDQYDYFDERKEALSQLANLVASLVNLYCMFRSKPINHFPRYDWLFLPKYA